MNQFSVEYAGLPGAEIVYSGLKDLCDSRVTESALLVLIATPNLRRAGIQVPDLADVKPPYEHRLYELIAGEHMYSAHSRYNSLIRRLVSFERALAWLTRAEAS